MNDKVNQYPQENLENIQQPQVKPKKKKGKKLIVLAVCMVVFISIFFIAYQLGYIPLFLSVKEPVCNYDEVDIGSLIEDFPEIGDMPNLDKLEYKAFDTDASIDDVVDNYHSDLINEGYSLEYSDTVELEGVTFEVRGYLKGLTAVAILTTDEPIENYNFDSLVFYATGNALDFREILDWYQDY